MNKVHSCHCSNGVCVNNTLEVRPLAIVGRVLGTIWGYHLAMPVAKKGVEAAVTTVASSVLGTTTAGAVSMVVAPIIVYGITPWIIDGSAQTTNGVLCKLWACATFSNSEKNNTENEVSEKNSTDKEAIELKTYQDSSENPSVKMDKKTDIHEDHFN